jgi:hippurate hydrolase
VIQAAELVVALQTIVSREVNPIAPAVVTVGSIHGGTKHNVIGNSCHLQLTVRSYADEVREAVLEAIKRKALAVAMGHRAPEPEIKISEGTPSLENDQDLVEKIVPVFRRVIGDENVTASEPSMGGEDFSRYGRAGVPIFMFALGTVEKKRLDRWEQLGQTPPSLHSSKYYPDVEPSLVTGSSCMAAAAMELLPRNE